MLCYHSIMEGIIKKCNKCKQDLPIEDFGDNGKGWCFTNCLPCRVRGRAENVRSRLRAKGVKLGALTSTTEQPSDTPSMTQKIDAEYVEEVAADSWVFAMGGFKTR